jgi:large subunit ribosomal protein L10
MRRETEGRHRFRKVLVAPSLLGLHRCVDGARVGRVPEASSQGDRCNPRKKCPARRDPHDGVSNVDRAQKRQLVSTLNEEWKSTGVMVIAHYKGMTVAQMTDFRKRMKDAGGSVKVAKNRLAKLALKDTDAEAICELLKGQTCIAYSEDPVSAAKISVKYSRENDKLVILGGTMGKTVMDVNAVKALADLPSLDELRAKLIGLVQAPATKIARILQEPGAMLARVVHAQGAKAT